jgi:small subunit ribosomal protein S2
MRQLLEAGAHFGHQTAPLEPEDGPVHLRRQRNDIHILDLSQTVPLLHQALLQLMREVAAGGGRVLFVGTKRQASEPVAPRPPSAAPSITSTTAGSAAR